MERNKGLRNLVLAGFGLIALFLTVSSPETLGVGPSAQVRAYAEHQLAALDGPSAQRLVASHSGSSTLLFVYASWCPYCKEQFKMLRALQTRYPDGLHIEYISLDENPYALSEFLMSTYPERPFTPYHVAQGEDRASFDSALAKWGFSPDGGIPHLMLLDADGKKSAEFKGLTQISALTDAIRNARPTPTAQ